MGQQDLFGNYEKIYVGFSLDKVIRFNGASGGAVTSLLVSAFERGVIEAALVVGMSKEKPWMPEVSIAGTREEIIKARGSKYTLIYVKEFLKVLDKEKRAVGVVGLPCHVRIIRKLMRLKRYPNIKLLIGLFCGYNMPYGATEFLLKKLEIDNKDIESLEYRGGGYPGGFLIKSKSGKQEFLAKSYYDFLNLMFVPRGCLNCRDYTNEQADISVGDAWGYENHSTVIARSEEGKNLLDVANVRLKEISEVELFKMHEHNIKHKKFGDAFIQKMIMKFLKKFGKHVPLRLLGFFAKTRRELSK